MDHNKGNDAAGTMVFGDWDPKNGMPDYSVNFTKIMETRKNKKNFNRASIGRQTEIIPTPQPPKFEDNHHDNNINVEPIGGDGGRGVEFNQHKDDHQPLTPARKTIWNYLPCCNKTKCV